MLVGGEGGITEKDSMGCTSKSVALLGFCHSCLLVKCDLQLQLLYSKYANKFDFIQKKGSCLEKQK